QNKLERAIEEARLAVAYAPENTRAHLLLLVSLFYHDEDPVDAAREALAISPYDAELHRVLGVALTRKTESIDAFNQLTYSVLLRPDRMEAHSELHRALLALINSLDAAKLFRQAISTIQESISKARSNNNTDGIALGEKFLGFFQSNTPIRQDPNSK